MVEGKKGALCVDCVPATVSAFEGPDSSLLTLRIVEDVLAHANPLAPLQKSRALVDAAAALAQDDADSLRRIVSWAIRLHCFEAALALLERIHPKTPRDAVETAWVCWRMGRFQAGLSALATLDPLALDAHDRIAYLLNHGALTVDADPSLPPDKLADLRSRIEEARMLALALPDKEIARHYLAGVCEGLAALALRDKDAKRAIAVLDDSRKHADLSPVALLLLGDAHAALGDDKAAHAAWLEAAKKAHPDTRDAQLARKRLTGVYR
jgi:hypothetical protein